MSTAQKRYRACDSCRRKKVRCDGPDPSGVPCASCTIYSVRCTYNDPFKPPRPRGYVQSLENRIATLEQLICEHSGRGGTGDSSSTTHGHPLANLRHKLGPLPANAYSKPEDMDLLSLLAEETSDSDDQFFSLPEANLGTTRPPGEPTAGPTSRFYGKSSLVAFTSRAFDERAESPPSNRTPMYRPEFWDAPDWLIRMLEPRPVVIEFPDMDLLQHLVDCYFDNHNVMIPILHRPSFVRSIRQGLHEVHQGFGAVVLLVCAIGCRFTDDPRVVRVISPVSSCTAWKFFHQVNSIQKHHYLPHTLYEAQLYPLTAVFLEAYSPPDTIWMIVAVGLRIMQDAGVHRKSFSSRRTLEIELWKRAFWSLVFLDRTLSSLLGRPCILQDEDFDTDLPLIYNDEDLDESDLKSPSQPDQTTQVSSFVCAIKLSQIFAFALRTIYSTKRSKGILGYVGKRWERNIVATLESALNKWLSTIPEYLRWGSEASKKNRDVLLQSLFLRCQFNEVQFHVHRLFALRDPPDAELSASSMIVCKNAAKECIIITDSVKDLLFTPLHCCGLMKPVFTSVVILMILSWKTGGIEDGSPEHRAIEAGTNLVDLTSERWRTSSCMRGMLTLLRGLTDGSYDGWTPRAFDLYRLQSDTIIYVGKDGAVSSVSGHRGPGTKAGEKIATPQPQVTVPPVSQGDEQLSTEFDGAIDVEPAQPNIFSPINFLANSTSFSFRTPVSDRVRDEGFDRPPRLYGNDPSLLSTEFIVYNDLMTDIGGTARFFDQDSRNSALFGSIPPGDTGSVQGIGFQTPSMMYE